MVRSTQRWPSVRRLADQLVELGDRFAHLGAQGVVLGRLGLAVGNGALDPQNRALGRSRASARRTSSIAGAVTHEGAGPQALTPIHSPSKGPASSAPRFPGPKSLPTIPHRRSRDAADRPTPCQRHSRSCDGRGRGRQQRASGDADGHGRRRHRLVHAPSEVRSGRPALARPRPLRAVGGPWLDADLRACST